MGRTLLEQLDESHYDPEADGYVYRFGVQRADKKDSWGVQGENKQNPWGVRRENKQNPWNGVRLYVGQTKNIRQRMSAHDNAGEGIEFWDEENQIYRTDIPYEVLDHGFYIRNFYKQKHDQPIKKVLKATERAWKVRMERDDRNRPPIVGGK